MASRKRVGSIVAAFACQVVLAGQVNYDELSRRSLKSDSATLEFAVEWKSDLSDRERQDRANQEVASVRQQWVQAGRTADSFKPIEAQLRLEMEVRQRKGKLVLSYSPNRFFYEFRPIAGAPDDPKNRLTLVYFNGIHCYRLLGRSVRVVSKPEYKDIEHFPLVGLRLWKVALFQKAKDESFFDQRGLPATPFRADVYWFNSVGGTIGSLVPGYAEGFVNTGHSLLRTLFSYSPKSPFTRIDFSNYRIVSGNWLAHNCRVTVFVVSEGNESPSGRPREHTDFRLTKFRPEYNEFGTSSLVTLLRNGDPITIEESVGQKEETFLIDKKSNRFQILFRDDSGNANLMSKLLVAACSGVGMLVVIVFVRSLTGGHR